MGKEGKGWAKAGLGRAMAETGGWVMAGMGGLARVGMGLADCKGVTTRHCRVCKQSVSCKHKRGRGTRGASWRLVVNGKIVVGARIGASVKHSNAHEARKCMQFCVVGCSAQAMSQVAHTKRYYNGHCQALPQVFGNAAGARQGASRTHLTCVSVCCCASRVPRVATQHSVLLHAATHRMSLHTRMKSVDIPRGRRARRWRRWAG